MAGSRHEQYAHSRFLSAKLAEEATGVLKAAFGLVKSVDDSQGNRGLSPEFQALDNVSKLCFKWQADRK
jgi:hypothetical protein